MLTDNPPKSWLTDVEPVGGNGDHVGIAAGDVASGMIDSRDDSDGVVVPHTDNSRRSEGVIEIDAPVTVDVGVNTEFGEATRIMVPATVDIAAGKRSVDVRDTDLGLDDTNVNKGSGDSDGVVTSGVEPADNVDA